MEVKGTPQEIFDFLCLTERKNLLIIDTKKESSARTEPPKKVVKIGNEIIS